jgi:CRISPR-associated protein Cas8b1/Cst1 subtype I-B
MENEEKLSDTMEGTSLITGEEEHAIEEETTDKMSQFKALMTDIILSALKENNSSLSSEISTNVTEGVIKEISYLERLREEKEEERFRKLDATLRDYQKSRMQVAASSNRKKSKFFKKNNRVYI